MFYKISMIIFVLLMFVLGVGSVELLAQGVPPPALPTPPPQTPIDGGLALLAAGGGAYAWRKLLNRKK